MALNKESIIAVELHVFGDVSIVASCAVVYVVVHQPSVTNQGLVVSKSRISKNNFAIPRLELVSEHMASDLVEYVKAALKLCNIRIIIGWMDTANIKGLCSNLSQIE